MKKSDVIHRVQRIIQRATLIIFFVICAMTVLIAFINKDPVTAAVMMAINLVIGGLVFGVIELVRRVTTSLYGPPTQ